MDGKIHFDTKTEIFLDISLNNQVLTWLEDIQNLKIILKKPRKNRLGDYSFDSKTNNHYITLNSDLSQFALFFVLTHELAHLFAYKKFGRKILPHGKEWKLVFANLLLESMDFYPGSWQNALLEHSKKPFANLLHDNKIAELLLPKLQINKYQLSNLKIDDYFLIKEKKFKVLSKNRKRYLCLCVDEQRKYWVHQNSWIKIP